MRAGSARNETMTKATARGSRASRKTRARIAGRRAPIARALRIARSYSRRGISVRAVRRALGMPRPESPKLGPPRRQGVVFLAVLRPELGLVHVRFDEGRP